jgi:hypothetical protein
MVVIDMKRKAQTHLCGRYVVISHTKNKYKKKLHIIRIPIVMAKIHNLHKTQWYTRNCEVRMLPCWLPSY